MAKVVVRPPVYFVGPEPTYNWEPKPVDPKDKIEFYKGDWRNAWPKGFKPRKAISTLAKPDSSSIHRWAVGD